MDSLASKLRALNSKILSERNGIQIHLLSLMRDESFVLRRQFLLELLTKVASDGFGLPVSEEEAASHSLIGQDYLLLIVKEKEIKGFVGLRDYNDLNLLYLSGVVFQPSCQGTGIAGLLFNLFLNGRHYDYIAFTTQSPRMCALALKFVRVLYPDFTGITPIPEEIVELGKELRAGRSGQFDPDNFVVRELYDRCLYPSIPESHNSGLNKFFKTALKIRGGKTKNGFLFIGRL
ncbi:hypothetical protein KKD19_01050 [Patescibacteria group bacterium]|nr:hypothetical protein [Patescibacteria group bacterium]MBU4511819.1 hypothetical protein [Patescibacteria group bacterium]MCG2692766.1 hypothetical protein [Candidatus Parcubacteria bacterium]